jgi:hypothetical protein
MGIKCVARWRRLASGWRLLKILPSRFFFKFPSEWKLLELTLAKGIVTLTALRPAGTEILFLKSRSRAQRLATVSTF